MQPIGALFPVYPGKRTMIATQTNANAVADRDPVVILAADDNFALPLAVTVRSALDNLAPDRKLRIYLMDAGMTDDSRARLLRSWPAGRFRIEWLKVDASRLAGLPISGHVNLVSYYRLLIPQILPVDLPRAIYLDADLIVRTDLARLWDCDQSGQLCLAAQDCASPFFDSFQTLVNYQLCRPHMGPAYPVPNFRELGFKPEAAYFNAGVLLIDLAAWRVADVSRRLLECLEEHRRHVVFWDQYALNVVLAGRWGQLDLRWNQGSHVFHYPTWEQSPFDRQTYEQVRQRSLHRALHDAR